MQPFRIAWEDRGTLASVLDSRLVAASGTKETPAADLWTRYFCKSIGPIPLMDHIFSIVLMRPRDLIFFVRAAISAAVDRRSPKVEEIDIRKAEASYSSFAYNSLRVETRERFSNIDEALYNLMGREAIYQENELMQIFNDSGEADCRYFISALCMCSFIEIYIPNRGYFAPADEAEFDRYYRAASNLERNGGQPKQFRIHRAFWDALLINDH